MHNPFRHLKHPFGVNRKQLRGTVATFTILTELERRGLIHWQRKQKILLIEESFATLKLAEGAEGFKHFLEQVAQWQNFRIIQEAYESYRIDLEGKAVRKATKEHSDLTSADIQRIRQNARDTMEPIDPDKLPNLTKEFDLFIIRATAPSQKEATEANGQLLALGHYDGKKLEMAMYDDVKRNLKKQ